MTTTETIQDDADALRPTFASRLAVLSFASGLALCCPGTGALAIVAGTLALVLGLRETDARWRKFAIGGVGLGVVSLVVLGTVYFTVHGWWEREGRVLYSGPNNALVALDQGEITVFRSEFSGPAASASDDAVQQFASELRQQFGTFLVCRSTRQSEPLLEGAGPWSLGEFEAIFKHDTRTTEQRVPAKIGLTRLPSGTLRLTWVELDAEGVRLRFPAEPTGEVTNR